MMVWICSTNIKTRNAELEEERNHLEAQGDESGGYKCGFGNGVPRELGGSDITSIGIFSLYYNYKYKF
jgi:hypothetical protein